jgi:hypothetical protein
MAFATLLTISPTVVDEYKLNVQDGSSSATMRRQMKLRSGVPQFKTAQMTQPLNSDIGNISPANDIHPPGSTKLPRRHLPSPAG